MKIAQEPVEPIDHPAALLSELVPPIGQQPEHHGVVFGSHPPQVGSALGHRGHGPGVDAVGLPPVAPVELAGPGGERGRDVDHDLAGGDELLGEQAPQAVGPLDGPCPLGPALGPSPQPSPGGRVGRHPQLAVDLPGLVERHGGVRGLVGIDPDGDHVRLLPAGPDGWDRGGHPEFKEAIHASIEPRHGGR